MNVLDIHFPQSDYETLGNLRHFNIIYPSDHFIASEISLHTLVQAISWDDEDYLDFRGEDGELNIPDVEHALDNSFLDVRYTRECFVRHVTKAEWNVNWGPSSLKEWLRFSKASADQSVKVICFVKPDYSLSKLNKGGYINFKKK